MILKNINFKITKELQLTISCNIAGISTTKKI